VPASASGSTTTLPVLLRVVEQLAALRERAHGFTPLSIAITSLSESPSIHSRHSAHDAGGWPSFFVLAEEAPAPRRQRVTELHEIPEIRDDSDQVAPARFS
jgi:hypothetical protein